MKNITLMILALLLPLTSGAQTSLPPGDAPCSAPEFRQFDFWAGTWTVTHNGQYAGTNIIEIKHNGCVLAENWTSAQGGFTGSSINLYDSARQRWHQTWADSSGTLLQLDGGLEGLSMVLTGTRPGDNQQTITDQISFTPNDDGSLRQHWQVKRGDGEWQTIFDGLYVRATEQ